MAGGTTKRQSLEQKRASQAFEEVSWVKVQRDKEWAKSYRSLVEGLPPMILSNGLGQSLAYLLGRAEGDQKRPESYICSRLEKWVMGEVRGLSGQGLLQALMEADIATYRRAQLEALAYLQWVKRFAQAMLPKGEDQGGRP